MSARFAWVLAATTLVGLLFIRRRLVESKQNFVVPSTSLAGVSWENIDPEDDSAIVKVAGYDYIWIFSIPHNNVFRIPEQSIDLLLDQAGDSLDVKFGGEDKLVDIHPLIERIRSCRDTSPVTPVPVQLRKFTLEFARGTVTVQFKSLAQNCNSLGQRSNLLGGVALIKLKRKGVSSAIK